MMEEALYSILTRPLLASLINDRCYPNERPQSANLPCITYTRMSGNRDHAMGGRTGLVESRYMIDCWAVDGGSKSGYLKAKELARSVVAIVAPLNSAFRELVSGVDIQGIFIRSERDYRADGASGVGKFSRISLDVTIWHTE